jgi:hypothetical protein
MFTKFGRHLSNVLEALGTKVKTLGVMVFFSPIIVSCMLREETRTPLEVMIALA